MSGTVAAIFVAPERRVPLTRVERVRAVPGRGLEGDRYFNATGSFSRWPGEGRGVSLIAQEAIDAVAREHEIDLSAGRHRRNIVTRGIDLNSLIGRRFRIGGAVFKGVRPCTPCKYLEKLVAAGTHAALRGRGGLRADVVEEGIVAVGDEIVLLAHARTGARAGDDHV